MQQLTLAFPLHPTQPTRHPTWLLRLWCLMLALAAGTAAAQIPTDALPLSVQALLVRAQVPPDAVAAVVLDTRTERTPLLQWRTQVPMNPASTLKLVTTFAALDLLGPAYTWQTKVWTDGPLHNGVLQGNLYLQGQGDPQLVTERLWLLLRQVQALGIERIAGNVVLDRSSFSLPPSDPGAFDGEPLRPYNAAPDALLINYRAQTLRFRPNTEAGIAQISLEPPLADVALPPSVPLAPTATACGDWRNTLRPDWRDAQHPRFDGHYPASCGERTWSIAHPEPEQMTARAVAGVWRSLGGHIDGQVRDGTIPAAATWRFDFDSPPLTDVVRDTNKFSNNVMAQQIYLSLGRQADSSHPITWNSARSALANWWSRRMGSDWPPPEMGNGSGLGREARISAGALGRLLQLGWQSSLMPDLMASLPASGTDGTLRRSGLGTGVAHLKTGSLKDVQALAGYVHGPNGQRRVLVVLVNHPNARAARPALEALVQWAAALPVRD